MKAAMCWILPGREYEELHVSRLGEHTRAFIKVQDGCNQFCSYCIIPYARGRVRSRKPEDVEAEVKAGGPGVQGSGAYGNPFKLLRNRAHGRKPGKGGDWDSGPLWDLIERIHRVEGLERIRLGSWSRESSPGNCRKAGRTSEFCLISTSPSKAAAMPH